MSFVLLAVVGSIGLGNASAWTGDLGLQVGASGRPNYHMSANAQIYAEAMVVRGLLSVGAYVNGYPTGDRTFPIRTGVGDVSFFTYGLRARLFLPLEGRVSPYAWVGVGRVTGDFPAFNDVDAKTIHFAEVPLGLGLRVRVEGPFVVSVEGAWRPLIGASYPAWDQELGGAKQVWTGHVGLGVTF